MAYGDRYLVETRSQTIRLITPEEADDLGRILSSQRYVITGTDPRFKRLLAHGYRLVNPQPRRVRPIDAIMNEQIPMPGFPQIIVTRGFAHQWLRAHGWDESEHGYGSLDYSIFQTRATSEPLTDPAERDRYLNDPGVSSGLSRNRDRNPQTGVHTINSDTLPVLRSVASSYGQSKLVKTFTGTTASETHRKAEILEQQGKTDGQQLEIFHVHGKSGTYGYAPSGLLDQATDAQESERDQDSGPDPREAARAERAKKSLESKLLKVRGEYQDKAERLIDEANRALDKYLDGDSVQAAVVAGGVERGCQEADKGGGKGLKAACKVFVRELTREENPNRRVGRWNGHGHGGHRNPDNNDPVVIGHYLMNRRGGVFRGSPDNVRSLYTLPDGRRVYATWDGWEVSEGAGYPGKTGSGVIELNDWLVNEPSRVSAREVAERQRAEQEREGFKRGRASKRIEDFIEQIRAGMERASGEPVVVEPPSKSNLRPEVKIHGSGSPVTVNLETGEYFAHGLGSGKAPKRLFDYLAKYGEWEG